MACLSRASPSPFFPRFSLVQIGDVVCEGALARMATRALAAGAAVGVCVRSEPPRAIRAACVRAGRGVTRCGRGRGRRAAAPPRRRPPCENATRPWGSRARRRPAAAVRHPARPWPAHGPLPLARPQGALAGARNGLSVGLPGRGSPGIAGCKRRRSGVGLQDEDGASSWGSLTYTT